MKSVFADAGYWIALLNPQDQLHVKAKMVSSMLGPARIVTSEMVLTEVLNSLAGRGAILRQTGVTLVKRLQEEPNTDIVPQTNIQFREALRLYHERHDKDWSLTDCASILLIQEKGIIEALAYDKHFAQAGVTPLLREED